LAGIFGNNFGISKAISVTFGGKPAYLLAVTNTQINVQIPIDAPLGTTVVVVGTSAPFNVTLAQYAPAVYTLNGRGTGQFASANRGPFQAGDTVTIAALGLGPTTPSVATGVTTPIPAPATTAKVMATIGGVAAAVPFAGLLPGAVGAYQVNMTVPPNLPSGNLPLVITVGGAPSQADVTVPVKGLPAISSVVNAASGNAQSLPNGGIAQGAVFTIMGFGLGPATLAIAPNAFTSTTLAGTSVSVTVKGATVAALMYYSSAGQIAGLLPSSTPVGTGTVTVTYNGATSAAAPVTVVQSNAGIFTTPPGGTGVAVVTFPDYSIVSSIPDTACGGPSTACGAANPKDVLILWLTGLGPVGAPDSSGPQPGNMDNLPLKLYIGGVEAQVSYQGRSGCCIGVDQVVFTVPDDVPTGCAVPMFIQIGNQGSNHTRFPVANGSRSCIPTNRRITPSAVAALENTGEFTSTQVRLRRRPAVNAQDSADRADAQFQKLRVVPELRLFFLSLVDVQPSGTCYVLNDLNLDISQEAGHFVRPIDAGPSLSLSGPNGNKVLAKTVASDEPTDYFLSIGAGYFSPGTYTVTGTGGADVGPFTVSLTIPAVPIWTNQANLVSVTRANGLTVTWSVGTSQVITITGTSFTDANQTTGASFSCRAAGGAGTFTVPPGVLLALPAVEASPNGAITFQAGPPPVNFTANGLTLASMDFNANLTQPVTFK
jgi:uncharacterized protein (TIGR03437 family)